MLDGKPRTLTPRRLHLVLAGLCIALLIAACSSGNAREAEQGQAARASGTARLVGLQATYSAGFINPGTPTAAPTPANLPTLDRLVLTRSVGGNGPAEELESVPANFGMVYAGALLNGLSRGTVVSAIWRGERGNISTSETTVEQDAAQAWVGLPLALDGSLAPGAYAVIVLVAVGGEPPVSLNSLVFEITSSGSQARALQPGRVVRIVPDDGEADGGGGEAVDGGQVEEGGVDGGPGEGSGVEGGEQGQREGGWGPPPIVPVDDDEDD